MKYVQECKKHNEYCEGCPYVTNHGGCTVGQPWKRKFTVVDTDVQGTSGELKGAGKNK